MQAVWIVPGCDEQGGRAVGANSGTFQQCRSMRGNSIGDPVFQIADLAGQFTNPVGQQAKRVDRGAGDVVGCGGREFRAAPEEYGVAQTCQCFA